MGKRLVCLLAALALGLTACGGTTRSRSSSSKSSASTTEVPVTATTAPQPTTTTVATTAVAPPTAQQVAGQIANTHETTDPSEGFIGSSPVTVSDGSGRYLTAVSALRNPSADGHGGLIFYADYAPGIPACCPSLPPVTITYSWSGAGFSQSRKIPAGAIVGITVFSG